MRLQLLVIFACALMVSAGRSEDKPAPSDKDKIQGTWLVVSAEQGGKPLSPEDAKTLKLVFAGDKLTLQHNDQKVQGPFKLDPDKKPKEMDVEIAGKTCKAIYQLDGDTLKIAHGEPGDPRPEEFRAKEGSHRQIMVLKRDKPVRTTAEEEDVINLLWTVRVADRKKLDQGNRDLLATLDKSKVPTVEKAEKAATAAKLRAGGLDAQEGARVIALMRVGVDVPKFADKGDLIWVVRFEHVLNLSVTQEMWVSSTTGEVRAILP
jgi:uncharacterized protein (TIGR03067 family)